ncbi:MAG: DUF4346 domain-containing protein [Thermoplasmata archaeon]
MIEVEEIQAKEKKKVEFDEKGFFVIYLDDEEIVAEHYKNVNKGGKLEVETGSLDLIIRGEDAKSISDTIIDKDLISRLDHMAYISRELQKAEIALKNDIDFEQSEDLEL